MVIFFMKFINIGPVYITGWVGEVRGGVGWMLAKAKTKKQDDTLVELRVVMTSACTHKRPIFYYKA